MRTAYVACFFATWLASVSCWALDAEKLVEQGQRVRKAYDEVKGHCAISEKTISVEEGEIRKQLTISRDSWTGECIDGWAEGEGTLTIKVRHSDRSVVFFYPAEWTGRGLMVHGKAVGPWMVVVSRSPKLFGSGELATNPEQGIYVWWDAPMPGQYVRNEDGSLTRARFDQASLGFVRVPGSEPIGAEAIAQHKSAFVDAARGMGVRGQQAPRLPVSFLRDFILDGRVSRSLGPELSGTRTKSAALLLTSQTRQSMVSMEDFSRQMNVFADSSRAADFREPLHRLAASVDARAIATGVARSIRRNFAAVTVVPDLAGFLASKADVAIVVDFAFSHEVAAVMRDYEKIIDGADLPFSASSVRRLRAGISYVVVNRRLEVEQVASFVPISPDPTVSGNRDVFKAGIESAAARMKINLVGADGNSGVASSLSNGFQRD